MVTLEALAGLLLGAGVAAGLILVVLGWTGHETPLSRDRLRTPRLDSGTQRRIAFAIGAGLIVAIATRWPVAAGATALFVVMWPRLFGGAASGASEVERVEALTVWTESLRDTVAGSMSLEQAIPATLGAAPAELKEPLQRLVEQLRLRMPLTEALARFSEELDDSSADLVIAALMLNASLRGPGLEAALTELAGHARDELELRVRAEAARRPLRHQSWVIVGFTLVFVLGLALFQRPFVEPYSTIEGQVALVVVLALFAMSFAWARKLSEYKRRPRFLISGDEISANPLLFGVRA